MAMELIKIKDLQIGNHQRFNYIRLDRSLF